MNILLGATAIMFLFLAQRICPQGIDPAQFASDYEIAQQNLLMHKGEVATISDFVYEKDVATFAFQRGEIHFQRYINGRPTTAIFIGLGTAHMDIPSHVERHALYTIAKDSVVNDTFTTCFIRFADDFDLRVKENFAVQEEELKWSDFNEGSKKAQGEFFFRPTIDHLYDNYFQLLRSAYDRTDDGFFWVNFNRYVFNFDPNRGEQTRINYQFEGSDIVTAPGALLQRKEIGIYDDSLLSRVVYESTPLWKDGRFELGGTRGLKIESGEGRIALEVETDSTRFLSLFLDNNLRADSVYCNGKPVGFHQRKDFMFVGVMLPDYAHHGDTLELKLWYKGFNYDYAFPFTENPRAVPHAMTLTCLDKFNFYHTDSSSYQLIKRGKHQFTVTSSRPYSRYQYFGYATGYDTVQLSTRSGLILNFIELKRSLGTSMKEHRDATINAFEFGSTMLGAPTCASPIFVCFGGPSGAMPGVVNVPTTRYSDYEGGIYASVGEAVFRQWFVAATSNAGYREQWIYGALAEYLCLLFVQEHVGTEAFYANLLARRNTLYTISERGRDIPLAVGTRALPTTSVNKGTWLLHMLRWLMYDLESGSEDSFKGFLRDLSKAVNEVTFTNNDFVTLAEKHFNGSLGTFFDYWLYSTGIPEFKVVFRQDKQANDYFIRADVVCKSVDSLFIMPAIIRVVTTDQVTFVRQLIKGESCQFTLGPFTSPPAEIYFNEFFGVLSRDDVSRQ